MVVGAPASRKALWLALGGALALQLAQAFALPLVMSWDSFLYVDHADAILTPRFATDFDFMRTPLFPLLLKAAFALLGKSAGAIVALNTALFLGGIVLLALALANWGHPGAAAAGSLALAATPSFIVYEHCALSEMGSFFFLALVAWALSKDGPLWRWAIACILALTAGYYFRPTIKYLAPVAAGLLAVFLAWAPAPGSRLRKLGWLLAVALVPALLAWPWSSNPAARERLKGQYLLGLSKQMVLPPEAPEVSEFRQRYLDALGASLDGGAPCLTGLTGGSEYAVMQELHARHGARGDEVFAQSALRYPGRYVPAVGRTLAVMLGVPGCDSDTRAFVRKLEETGVTGTRSFSPPPALAHLTATFERSPDPNALGRLVLRLFPASQWVLLVANLLLGAWLVLGLWWRERALVALAALALAFYAMHALVLMAFDRLAVPAHPLGLACAIVGGSCIWRRLRGAS